MVGRLVAVRGCLLLVLGVGMVFGTERVGLVGLAVG
jgi:hypothetical protein